MPTPGAGRPPVRNLCRESRALDSWRRCVLFGALPGVCAPGGRLTLKPWRWQQIGAASKWLIPWHIQIATTFY